MFSKSFVALLVLALTASVNAVPVCDCILKRDAVLATTLSARQGCCQPISERAVDLDARQDTVLPRLCECILKRDAAPGAPLFSRQCCTPDEPIVLPPSESVVPTPVIDSLVTRKNRRGLGSGLGSDFGHVFESVAESAAASIAVNQAASAVESFAADPSIPTPFIPIPRGLGSGLGSDFGHVFESVAESAAASIAVHQAASAIGSFVDPPATTPGSAAVPTPFIDSLIPRTARIDSLLSAPAVPVVPTPVIDSLLSAPPDSAADSSVVFVPASAL